MADGEQKVRERAYQLWIEEGQPHGRSDAHWRRARELVDAETTTDDGGAIGADSAVNARDVRQRGARRSTRSR